MEGQLDCDHSQSGGGKDLLGLCAHSESKYQQTLYGVARRLSGVKRFAVNGPGITPHIERGYAVVTRQWKAGDRVELELPMEPPTHRRRQPRQG